jgi:hypothetical protein
MVIKSGSSKLQLLYSTEDSAMLHLAIKEGLNMENLENMDVETLKSLAGSCKIPLPSSSTKVYTIYY